MIWDCKIKFVEVQSRKSESAREGKEREIANNNKLQAANSHTQRPLLWW